MNILSPDRFMSKYASAMAPNTAQIEIEKWDGGIHEMAPRPSTPSFSEA
jgi:trimethylamine-N-oxide reductase (cytochrome c)